MRAKKSTLVRVDTLGLEPDEYIYIGAKMVARYELADGVKIESRHGDEFVIPESTMVRACL